MFAAKFEASRLIENGVTMSATSEDRGSSSFFRPASITRLLVCSFAQFTSVLMDELIG
jgi:hypothetical protein